MKKKLLAVLLVFSLLLVPAFAEDSVFVTTEDSVPKALSVYRQQMIIKDYAHTLADNYYYGVTDENLLYNVICATIENDGIFDIDVALEAMIYALNDDYAEYYSPQVYSKQTQYYDAEFFGIGVTLTISGGGTVIESVFSGSAAEVAGLRAGDEIVYVDGADASGLMPAQVRELISGEEGTAVEVTVLRGGELFTARAARQRVTESHSSMEIRKGNIGYIDIDSFTLSLPEEIDSYISELESKGVKNVIIDLRDNGGGEINAAIAVAQKLIPAGVIGKFKYRDEANNRDILSENTDAPDFKLLVLVNENSASASEFLAMTLQSSGRAQLMGTETFGKGCMQVMLQTPTGSGLKFTIGEFFTPNDERIHTVGLTPDIEVENIYRRVDESSFAPIDILQLNIPATRLGIEQRLNALSLLADGEVDGFYDSATKTAIRVFQQYRGLEVTGEVDVNTALAINDYDYDNITRVEDIQMESALAYFR